MKLNNASLNLPFNSPVFKASNIKKSTKNLQPRLVSDIVIFNIVTTIR